jgi:murein DD-endopeptidase MepM/ murein hydrolase activator NlpD
MLERTPETSRWLAADPAVEAPHAGIELGHEPPLDVNGLSAPPGDRRGVSLRWLIGSVLTGLSGALLLGSAIYVSVEGDSAVAELPESVAPPSPKAQGAGPVVSARKADRLVKEDIVISARQAMKAPMTLRVADREVIKVRSFVRIASALTLTSGQYATDIPTFDPVKLFAEGTDTPERAPEQPDTGDADVSIVKRDLTVAAVEEGAPALSDEDAAAQAAEERRLIQKSGENPVLPIPAQMMLQRTLSQPAAADGITAFANPVETSFSNIEVRMVPENVTVLPKTEAAADKANAVNAEQIVALKKGETLEQVLRANGADDARIRAILGALSGTAKVTSLAEGQRVRLLVGPGPGPGNPRQILRVMLLGDTAIEAIAAIDDRGQFVSVAPPASEDASVTGKPVAEGEDDSEDEESGRGVRLYESLYETAAKNKLPQNVVEELIRIFAYDVDFQRRVASGDTFELFYASDEDNPDNPEILYASLTTGGETHQVYRYQSAEDGSVDYFDPNGRSLKKFLLRKPIAAGELRSTFGMRYHPILHYSKMHTGVDWANKIGTPILAAGNGTIIKAGWTSGYGRHTEIQHANGYVTTYSHQSAFAKGIVPGARVRQGQVIGYLGSSGLSTGPHLHYEVLVNSHFVNPLKIKVPRGRELEGRVLADFKRQRDQVTALLSKAANTRVLAQSDTQ